MNETKSGIYQSNHRQQKQTSDPRPMKSLLSISTLAASILLQYANLAIADEILVVAREDAPVESLNRTETANLFLGLGRTLTPLIPFDQQDKELRQDFYREVAGLSLVSVRAHWAKRVFTGRGRPPAMLSTDQVAPLINQSPVAVTYIPEAMLPQNGKTLLLLPREKQE